MLDVIGVDEGVIDWHYCHYFYYTCLMVMFVNVVQQDGFTPLHSACFNEHVKVVKVLLKDSRVDITKINKVSMAVCTVSSCMVVV